jgi:hypothetical protein
MVVDVKAYKGSNFTPRPSIVFDHRRAPGEALNIAAPAVSQTAYKCSAVTFSSTAVTIEGRGVKLLLLHCRSLETNICSLP